MLIDNYQEYKRSIESPQYFAKTYETNYLINVCQYVQVLNQNEFQQYRDYILRILKALSETYLFEDIGFTLKNSYNWGKRQAILTEDERWMYPDPSKVFDLVILDYGYLYPWHGQKDRLFRCPKCNHKLAWNVNYTSIACTNVSACKYEVRPTELRRQMNLRYDAEENAMMSNFSNIAMPDLSHIEQEMAYLDANSD